MYPLSVELIEFLLSVEAQVALADLRGADLRDEALFARVAELRRRFDPPQAAVLLDQALLRRKACGKFEQPDRLYFVDEALEQATSRAVAVYRARSFGSFGRVADLGCGIGADTLALAEVVPSVLAVELDPVRARLAELNIAASGLSGRVRVVCADWTTMALGVEAAFVDPVRRSEGRRVFGLAEMSPSLAAIRALLTDVPNLGVKVAPGVDHAEVPSDAEIEFIAERGYLKEAFLRFGALCRGAARVATVLPGPHQVRSDTPVGEAPVSEPLAYLYEPDPAVIRASLVTTLAAQIGAAQVDSTIAYLTSDRLASTPLARVWQVERHGHFNLKVLNSWLLALGVGHVVIKKRGSPIDPDAFRRRLKLVRGGRPVTVFFTRALGNPWMIVAAEIRSDRYRTRDEDHS
ncbi:MAG: class I SAM-dependent methyltransferase [Anaerolineae bacterium]|nr:class I SAM-dependent methyltransferase [Anaerolineae bacterium]